jgi:hypothetical protein
MINKSTFLYRTIRFDHLVQIFRDRQLYFSNPSQWDDPYETRLNHPAFQTVAAQCWCKHSVSDAMWRIYSPHQLGVRIKTTKDVLLEQLGGSLEDSNRYSWRMDEVVYDPQRIIDDKLKALAESLQDRNDYAKVLDSLFWKRRAFVHEAEVRAVVFDKIAKQPITHVHVPIDPDRLIKSVLFDPRASKEMVDVYTHYLKNKLGYQGRISQSALYKKKPFISIPEK